MPNETWQSDFTHYRLTRPDGRPGADVEIITWLDDCTRYALHVTAHPRVTAPIVLAHLPRKPLAQHGIPASTLTDNGMVYTARLAGGRGGRNGFETRTAPTGHRPEELPTQPPHHLRQGRAVPADDEEVAARPTRPAHHHRRAPDPPRPLRDEYNHRRPHRSLPHRATPATALRPAMPKATPGDRPRPRHPRPGPPRQASTRPAPSPCAYARPTAPHRHRPNPRRNPRHPARPRPRRPRRQRHHRRTPPRAHPRPRPRLPATTPNEQHPNPSPGPGVADVLRHHTGGGGGI